MKSLHRPRWCYMNTSASSCSFFFPLFSFLSVQCGAILQSHTPQTKTISINYFLLLKKIKVTTTKITIPEENQVLHSSEGGLCMACTVYLYGICLWMSVCVSFFFFCFPPVLTSYMREKTCSKTFFF